MSASRTLAPGTRPRRRRRPPRRKPGLGLGLRLRRLSATAWTCALIACLNAASWSIVTPPFQVPDEPDHVAYVQQLAETGRLPSEGAAGDYTEEEIFALNDLRQGFVRFKPQVTTISSLAQQRKLERDLSAPLPRAERVKAGVAGGEPALYYALEAIPYKLASSGTLLDRVALIRLLSALMGGLAAIFTFLFVRETLPGVRWAASVGALSVALMPLFGFVSGGVNPEALFVTASAALFYAFARAFRRGFTQARAAAIGVAIGVGILTKLNFLGLAPGAFLGLALLTAGAARSSRSEALAALGVAASLVGAAILLYMLTNLSSGRPALGEISGGAGTAKGSVLHELSYVWQFYLPRLPGMKAYFPGMITTHALWFNGFVGLYGWVDTVFPAWVYDLALLPAGALAALLVNSLVRSRGGLRRHRAELVVYATMAIGLLALVGTDSYISETVSGAGPYWEPRYFLPLVPLLAVALALAAKGAGRLWERTAGVAIVLLFFAHDVFSQLQVVARYYG